MLPLQISKKLNVLSAAVMLFTSLSYGATGTVWAPETPFRPPLREEVSLSGIWNFTPKGGAQTTIAVPEYWDAQPGFKVSQALYQRDITIPADWKGKKIFLDFEGINMVADVSINDKEIGQHVGGWVPVKYDITGLAVPGSTVSLSVSVKGGDSAPVLASDGRPLWPLGWTGATGDWGIIYSVWLRAYGTVSIDDAYIQPSFRNKSLTVDYIVTNHDSISRSVTLTGDVKDSSGSTTLLSLPAQTITIAAGDTDTVKVSQPWANPILWSPDQPNLLRLHSQILDDTTVIDQETRQFGFREVWIEGNQYRLNGIRLNLIGTSLNWHSQFINTKRYTYMYPDNWGSTIDTYKSVLNHNVFRLHMEPTPDWMLDVADRKGMLIVVQSAIMGWSPNYTDAPSAADKPAWLSNCTESWIPQWVPGFRNHPSICLVSIENEASEYMTSNDIKAVGDAVNKYEWTIPKTANGDRDQGNLETDNRHYPEEYNLEPTGSIYSWTWIRSSTKPINIDEFITDYGPANNVWWQGNWSRGLRYLNCASIQPYTTQWAAANPTHTKEVNLANSFAPVALFDSSYDDAIDPVAKKIYPTLAAGETSARTLFLYNDEYRGEKITVKVEVRSDSITYASGIADYTVGLGDHVAIPCTFEVPYVGGSTVDLVLATSKDGVQKFSEARRFNVTGTSTGTSSDTVSLGDSRSAINRKIMTGHNYASRRTSQLMCLGNGGIRHSHLNIVKPGPYKIVVTNIAGAVVKRFNGNGPALIDLSSVTKGSGLYIVHMDEKGAQLFR